MVSENILYAILLFVFIIILLIISAFLIRQMIKSESVARPFLLSLFLYFFIIAIGHFFQMSAYLVREDDFTLSFKYLFISGIFYLTAPVYFIYQVEKNFAPDIKIVAKYHLITLTTIILLAILYILSIIFIATEPDFFETYYSSGEFNVGFTRFNIIILPIWFLENILIILPFLYLSLKSVEKYRLYSLLVSIGWTFNQLSNIIFQLFFAAQGNPIVIILFFIGKFIGAIVTAYFLYKLYTLKRELS